MSKKGLLLINLGSPADAGPRAVYRYLREFLNDARVIDLPRFARSLLAHFIAVVRHRKSAKAYQKIWSKGSPLLENSSALVEALSLELGEDYQVEIAMRYGKPSFEEALAKLKSCHSLTVIPLYPQYSSAATGSALEKLFQQLGKEWNIPDLRIVRDFHADPGFIQAFATLIQNTVQGQALDQVVFSYHGLPERQVKKSHCRSLCKETAACSIKADEDTYCYRAQCYRSSTLLAEALQLKPEGYSVAFQSRLGRTPWIKPYTDQLLPTLRQQGMKKIAVVCPSFVADCLETLEEIDMRAREQWQALGGESFIFIPCLNAEPVWVKALATLAKR